MTESPFYLRRIHEVFQVVTLVLKALLMFLKRGTTYKRHQNLYKQSLRLWKGEEDDVSLPVAELHVSQAE